jgi:hypothetical protein
MVIDSKVNGRMTTDTAQGRCFGWEMEESRVECGRMTPRFEREGDWSNQQVKKEKEEIKERGTHHHHVGENQQTLIELHWICKSKFKLR